MTQPPTQQGPIVIRDNNFNQGVITGSVIATIIVSMIFLGIWFLFLNHQGANQPVYKEYSSVGELYKNAALGDRAKVTIMAANPPANVTGSVFSIDTSGVVFRIPPAQLNNIKLLPGRNIVYVLVAERFQSTIVCDIEKVTD